VVPCAERLVIALSIGIEGWSHRSWRDHRPRAAEGYRYAFSLSAGPVTMMASLAAAGGASGDAGRGANGNGLLALCLVRLRTLPLLWRYADPLTSPSVSTEAAVRPPDREVPTGRWLTRPRVQLEPDAAGGRDGGPRSPPRARWAHPPCPGRGYLAWRTGIPCTISVPVPGGRPAEGYLVLRADPKDPARGVSVVDLEATRRSFERNC